MSKRWEGPLICIYLPMSVLFPYGQQKTGFYPAEFETDTFPPTPIMEGTLEHFRRETSKDSMSISNHRQTPLGTYGWSFLLASGSLIKLSSISATKSVIHYSYRLLACSRAVFRSVLYIIQLQLTSLIIHKLSTRSTVGVCMSPSSLTNDKQSYSRIGEVG